MRVKITVTKNSLRNVAGQLPQQALAIVQQVGAGILSRTVADTHIVTGEMARGWQFDAAITDTGAFGEISNNVEHAVYEEFGTGARGAGSSFPGKPEGISYTAGWMGREAHPALTPAVEAARPEWKSEWRSLRRRLRA